MNQAALHLVDNAPLSPKDRLGWWASRGHLSPSQRQAGDILMGLKERSMREAYATCSGSGQGGSLNPMEAKMTARSRYERAITAVTPFGAQVIDLMVTQGLSTEQAAKVMVLHPKAMLPLLRLSLEVLAQHYHLP